MYSRSLGENLALVLQLYLEKKDMVEFTQSWNQVRLNTFRIKCTILSYKKYFLTLGKRA